MDPKVTNNLKCIVPCLSYFYFLHQVIKFLRKRIWTVFLQIEVDIEIQKLANCTSNLHLILNIAFNVSSFLSVSSFTWVLQSQEYAEIEAPARILPMKWSPIKNCSWYKQTKEEIHFCPSHTI